MKTISAEIITIGDEILYGQITDTNSQYISKELDKMGIKVRRQSSVGDQAEDILDALKEAEARVDLVLMTGGLGPTKDDITKKTLCKFFDTELVMNEKVLAMVTKFFEERGREVLEVNRQQAAVPQNCEVLFNRLGTAPAMWFEKSGKIFVSMPGVPYEMKILMQESVLPKIQKFFQTPIIFHKVIQTVGQGESYLSEKIAAWEENLPDHIKLAYLPHWGSVSLRLTAMGQDLETLEKEVEAQVNQVVPLIEKYVFGYDKDQLEAVIGQLLMDKGMTVASAESCTGGYIAHLITKVAGSSRYYEGSVISYSNAIKMSRLGVKEETLKNHGAVSEATVREMAEQVRERFKTSIGVASSGVAGPGGGSPEKPVGTVWVALADEGGTYAKKLQLTKDRLLNIRLTGVLVLDLIRRRLQGFIKPESFTKSTNE